MSVRSLESPARIISCLALLVLVSALPKAFAEDDSGLTELLSRSDLIVAAQVIDVPTYDSGRVAVAHLHVTKTVKGTPPAGEVAVVETRDLSLAPIFAAGDHVLAFLRPAKRNSYLAGTLPQGEYFEPSGHAVTLRGSTQEIAQSALLLERLFKAGQKRVERNDEAAKTSRALAFDLLDSGHALLVEEGAKRLARVPNLAATLTTAEQERIEQTLDREALPARVQVAFLQAIASAELTQLVPHLKSFSPSSPDVMLASWQALARLGHAPTDEELADYLVREDPSVRAAAARGLIELKGAEALSAVRVAALRDPDPMVRKATIDALGDAKMPEALPILEQAFADESWEITQAAARAITAIGGRPAMEAFSRLAFAAPTRGQVYAVVALLALGVGRDDPLVEQIAQTHPNEAVRNLLERGLAVHKH